MNTGQILAFGLMASVALGGCKKDDEEPPPMPVATTEPAPPAQSAVLAIEEPAPGEVVRPELDKRDDGGSGNTLTVQGAKANVKMPSDWKVTNDKVVVATSPDGKLRLSFKAGATATSELDALTSAAGVSGCEWRAEVGLTLGKDKLSGQGADGKCASKPAAYVSAENLVAFGSWDDGADRTPLFSILRSIAKASTGGGSASNLVACCRLLAQNAKSAPPPQNAFMMQAAATCEAAARNNDASAVNSALSQFGMKCR